MDPASSKYNPLADSFEHGNKFTGISRYTLLSGHRAV